MASDCGKPKEVDVLRIILEGDMSFVNSNILAKSWFDTYFHDKKTQRTKDACVPKLSRKISTYLTDWNGKGLLEIRSEPVRNKKYRVQSVLCQKYFDDLMNTDAESTTLLQEHVFPHASHQYLLSRQPR